MLQHVNKCACGKQYKLFQSYKRHIDKHKCHQKKALFELTPPEIPQTTQDFASQNANTQISINPNVLIEFTVLSLEEFQRTNTTPKCERDKGPKKTKCIYCNKEFLKHNINRHQTVNCKQRFKRLPQYKLLVKAGVNSIPEDTIEILELYEKIIQTQPELLYNAQLNATKSSDTDTIQSQSETKKNVEYST
jgi:hypothetical protein